MRAVIQRVQSAGVSIDGADCARIDRGLLVLVGVARGDTPADGTWLARKIAQLRIFPEEAAGPESGPAAVMNRSVIDIGGGVLVVSQFTLHARVDKGTRPSYHEAAGPEVARPLYDEFILHLQTALGRLVQAGRFGAMMKVSLVNDGPVTIVIDTQGRT